MADVQVLTGTGRSGREPTIDALLLQRLPGARLLVPTGPYARARTQRFVRELNMPGLWGQPIQTFQTFVESMLRAGKVDAQPLPPASQRLLLEGVVDRLAGQGKLAGIGAAAETEGFVTHILRVIRHLKQGAVEPEVFRARVVQRAHPSPLDSIVADVYEAYQDALKAARVYDQEGLYWEASLLAEGADAVPGLEEVKVLLLDGFDEFTLAQLRLLKRLALHLDCIVFGLAIDIENNSAQDLYHVPLRTLGIIEKLFEHGEVEFFDTAPVETLSQYGAQHLFWRDMPPAPEGLCPNVRVMPCTTATQEIEAIARRVKTLIMDEAVAPGDIAIVYRNPSEVQDTLRAVFAECGVPLRMHAGVPLARSAVGAFALCLFEALAAWERDAVCDVLGVPWFHGRDADDQSYLHALVRAAGIIRGREEWQQRLERLASHLSGQRTQRMIANEDGEPMTGGLLPTSGDAARVCKRLLQHVHRLAKFDDAMGFDAPEHVFAQRLLDGLDAMGLNHALATLPDDVCMRETPAADALYGLLGRMSDGGGVDTTDAISRDEFTRRLRQAMKDTEFHLRNPRRGVLCCSAEAVRHLTFPHVFFAALNEGIVPQRPALNAVYSDEDMRDLVESGIDLERHQFRAQYEMLLFHRVVEAATDTLWLSYRTLSADGKAVLESPYLTDLLALVNGGHAVERIPAPLEAASWPDLRNGLFAIGPEAASMFPERFDRELHSADVESRRARAVPCDAYDGMLDDDAMIAAIGSHFGADHTFSVSQIETYISCPFRFFLERVLNVETPEAPAEEFDPMMRGAAYHAILERFHRAHAGRSLPDMTDDERTDAERMMVALARECVEAIAAAQGRIPASLVALESQRAAAVMLRYLRIESGRTKDADWKPSHFEVSFGRDTSGRGGPPSRSEPFVLETPGGPVRFAGVIDRVDRLGSAKENVRLVDYKSSITASAGDAASGRSIQLGLYALAFEQLIDPQSRCGQAWFLQIGRNERREVLNRDTKNADWDKRQERIRQAVADAVADIRAGRFHPALNEKACSYCPGRHICRHESTRMVRKGEAMRAEARP